MIEAVLLLIQVYGDWRDIVRPADWRKVEDSPSRQIFVREEGNLSVRIETAGGSAVHIRSLDCTTRSARAAAVNRYGRNNLEGPTMPSPPGVFRLPQGPGSEVEAVAAALCPPEA